MGLGLRDGWAIPFDEPLYPPLPAAFRHVQFGQVFLRVDPAALAGWLPEPLEPSPDGLCIATGIRVPASAYGPLNEAALELKALFRGVPGWYCARVWHDGPSGIAAGREIYGTPKVFSTVEIEHAGPTMITRAAVAGRPVIQITATAGEAIEATELPAVTPTWLLKLIPRADGPGPAIKQLIEGSSATTDVVVHSAYRATGSVEFAAPAGRRPPLSPIAIESAYVFEASYREGFSTIAYDYLAET